MLLYDLLLSLIEVGLWYTPFRARSSVWYFSNACAPSGTYKSTEAAILTSLSVFPVESSTESTVSKNYMGRWVCWGTISKVDYSMSVVSLCASLRRSLYSNRCQSLVDCSCAWGDAHRCWKRWGNRSPRESESLRSNSLQALQSFLHSFSHWEDGCLMIFTCCWCCINF